MQLSPQEWSGTPGFLFITFSMRESTGYLVVVAKSSPLYRGTLPTENELGSASHRSLMVHGVS